ncbi:MAG: phosphoribosyl-AMP cyclohydrolase [Solirubrobacterales bacterium]
MEKYNVVNFKDLKLQNGLIPVIVQDYENNEVLMMAYMNEESFNKTIETGKTWFYSRSRNELWNKGGTSGHIQVVKQMSIDCDKDTILVKVLQTGAACHTGNRSCFYTEVSNFELR